MELDEEKTKIEIERNTQNQSVCGGVSGLLKVLTKTMEIKGNSIFQIANMQSHICRQFGIDVGSDFLIQPVSSIECFLSSCVVCTDKNVNKVNRVALYDEYESFCELNDLQNKMLTRNKFYKKLRYLGFCEIRLADGNYFTGIGLSESSDKQ